MLIPKVSEETKENILPVETTEEQIEDIIEDSSVQDDQTEIEVESTESPVIDAHTVHVEEIRTIKRNKRMQIAFEKEERRQAELAKKAALQAWIEKEEEAKRTYTHEEIKLREEAEIKRKQDIRERIIAERESKKQAAELVRKGLK